MGTHFENITEDIANYEKIKRQQNESQESSGLLQDLMMGKRNDSLPWLLGLLIFIGSGYVLSTERKANKKLRLLIDDILTKEDEERQMLLVLEEKIAVAQSSF